MNGWRSKALIGAILLQLLVLAAELGGAVYPRWFGQAVQLTVEPVDPRSLFRGNYAQLRYQIGEVQLPSDETVLNVRAGERVYVSLVEDGQGRWQAQDVHFEPPDSGLFIRGRIRYWPGDTGTSVTLHIRYGIEAYFLPRDKALALEDELRSGGVATVMIAPDGKAALLGVEAGSPTQ